MSEDWDAIVVGAGPNGLVTAATLARHGWRVLVLEAKNRPGGALYSEELTLPGFLHDVGAAFFPFADGSPAFGRFQQAAEHANDGGFARAVRPQEPEDGPFGDRETDVIDRRKVAEPFGQVFTRNHGGRPGASRGSVERGHCLIV